MDRETIQEIEDLRKDISYAVLESFQFQNERREKRDFIVKLVLIFLLVFTNTGWLVHESQMEKVTETSEITTIDAYQDGDSVNIVGGGDINYGATSENYKNSQEKDLQTAQEKEVGYNEKE